jgi:hypothetical protein
MVAPVRRGQRREGKGFGYHGELGILAGPVAGSPDAKQTTV